MEEETSRISQGQVPEAESFVMTQKDALPPSFNAIFSPPEHYSNSSANPPAEVHIPKEANGIETHEQPAVPMVVEDVHIPPQDYDSDEGVGIDISVEGGKEDSPLEDFPLATEVVNPTDEEVDAALAELDSIPDGGCEAGEVEDEDDDDEEWAYYKMEPQKHQPQNEDLIAPETSKMDVEDISAENENIPEQLPHIPDNSYVKDMSPSSSPPAPSSPRTVEGFVTSVELNTPEESYNTNLAINQSTEYFNGGQIEQNSGPFSVYVSSSPEPASIETPPVNLHATMPSTSSYFEEDHFQREESKVEIETGSASVEIVHAQSTVEVMSDFPTTEVDIHSPENPLLEDIGSIPDIMTQSFTGDTLPTEPYVDRPPLMEFSQKQFEEIPEVNDEYSDQEFIHFTSEMMEPSNEDVHIEAHFIPNVTCSPVSIDITGGSVESTHVDHYEEFQENSQFHELHSYLPEDQIPPPALADLIEHITLPAYENIEPNEPELPSSPQNQFTEQINKAFDQPLDPMFASFHENRVPLEDVTSPVVLEVEPTAEESPIIPDIEMQSEALIEIEMQSEARVESPVVTELADQLAEIKVTAEKEEISLVIPKVSPKIESKRPVSAPRTTVSKSAPPKPSPRSVESKLASNRLSATNSQNASSAPQSDVKPSPKRPATLSASSKPLKKTELPKVSSTATKTRLTSMTSRTSSLQSSRPSTAPATNTTTTTRGPTTGLKAKATPSLSRPKPSPSQTGTAAPKTNTIPVSKIKPTSTTTTSKSKLGISATKRLSSSTSKSPSTSTTTTSRGGTVSNVPNGEVSSTKTTTRTITSTKTSSNVTKKPLPTKTTTTTSSTKISGVTAATKPLTTAKTTATSTLKQKSTTAPPSTKETKNTTNRMLSTSRTSSATARLSSQSATKTSTTTTTMTKSRLSTQRTNKTPVLRSKKESEKSPKAPVVESDVTNGENKIVEEESSVEVKEKLEEERSEITEKVLDLSSSKAEAVGPLAPESILVNGDY